MQIVLYYLLLLLQTIDGWWHSLNTMAIIVLLNVMIKELKIGALNKYLKRPKLILDIFSLVSFSSCSLLPWFHNSYVLWPQYEIVPDRLICYKMCLSFWILKIHIVFCLNIVFFFSKCALQKICRMLSIVEVCSLIHHRWISTPWFYSDNQTYSS